jgi:hypothetical protein
MQDRLSLLKDNHMRFNAVMKEAVVYDKDNPYDKLGFFYKEGRPTHVEERIITYKVVLEYIMAMGGRRMVMDFTRQESHHVPVGNVYKADIKYETTREKPVEKKMGFAAFWKACNGDTFESRNISSLYDHMKAVAQEEGFEPSNVASSQGQIAQMCLFLYNKNKRSFSMTRRHYGEKLVKTTWEKDKDSELALAQRQLKWSGVKLPGKRD